MKKIIFVLSMLVASISFAQTINVNGQITLNNGQTTVGIAVGNPNANPAELVKRVLMLEQAVRDLQIQVYNLTVEIPVSLEVHKCEITAFSTRFVAEAATEVLAKDAAREKCLRENNEMFCKEKDIKCKRLQ